MKFLAGLFWAALIGSPVMGQIPHAQDEPPGPPLSTDEALRRFKTPPGFKVELFAAEPDVVNPVAMTFDERGRVWVAESLEYPRKSAGPGLDRIRILEDSNADGKADRVSTFAEGLNIPSGIALGYGGAFVVNSPDLLFLKDTDGDGKADKQEVLLTGFGRDDTHELPSALIWGPDGWLYGLNGVFNYSKITHQGKTHEFTCGVWRYHPRSKAFEIFCQGTSNPWGLDYDRHGQFFVSACVIDHLWHLTESGYYHRQAGPYPPYTWKIESIVDYKHQKAAYCGLCVYDAEVYPEEYRGTLFMGNVHGNCINNDSVAARGGSYVGKSMDDFLAIDDAWFMPVVQKVGPDGCLWVVDWYDRYHCYQDANRDPAGIDRLKGRIYRITYKGSPAAAPFDLARLGPSELNTMLGDSNGWKRREARRLLVERKEEIDCSAVGTDKTHQASPPIREMELFWAAITKGQASNETMRRMLASPHADFRAWAVRSAGEQRQSADANVRADLSKLYDLESDPTVRIQLAIAGPKLFAHDSIPQLLKLLENADNDPSGLTARIIWRNLEPLLDGKGRALALWLNKSPPKAQAALREILPRIIERLIATSETSPQEWEPILGVLFEKSDHDVVARSLEKILEAATSGGLPESAYKIIQASHSPTFEKIAASKNYGDPRFETGVALAAYFSPKSPAVRQTLDELWAMGRADRWPKQVSPATILRALSVHDRVHASMLTSQALGFAGENRVELRELLSLLTEIGEAKTADEIVRLWSKLPTDVAPQAIDGLSTRKDWSAVLLKAVADKRIPTAAVNANQIRRMAGFDDATLKAKVAGIWGQIREGRNPNREKLAADFLHEVQHGPRGDAALGVKVFDKICAQCHQFKGKGVAVGPSLNENGRTGLPLLVSNILDPNLVIGKDYQARLVVLDDGRTLTGLVIEETPVRLVLKLAGDKREVILKSSIERMKVSDVSLMPEDTEKQMTRDEFRHLIQYLIAP